MTINIGLITSDGLILGCDSIASSMRSMIDPFSADVEYAKDDKGKLLVDSEGNSLVAISPDNITRVVTSAFGGAKKMFSVYENGNTAVAAITSGMGKVRDRTIYGLVEDFIVFSSKRAKPYANVETVVKAFLKFIRKEYEIHYKNAGIPEDYWTPLNFLIGGYGKNDKFPSLYRIAVETNSYHKHFAGKEGDCGVAWGGQADSVERLVNGYSHELKYRIDQKYKDVITQYRKDMEKSLSKIFKQVIATHGAGALDGIDASLPTVPTETPDWVGNKFIIDYPNLPMQDAVDFVSAMVNSQSGLQKFSTAIATVGGRTHIGVIEKGKPLNMLDEQALIHRHTGYADV